MKLLQKIKLSGWSVVVCIVVSCVTRFSYYSNNEINGYNATSWDALGYYLYLPGTFIYDDIDQLTWMDDVDHTYHVTGGYYYQATPLENGNYVSKYLCGVALMELPFFVIAHVVAGMGDFPQDGFSTPYQYAVLWAAIFWFIVGIVFLRKVLRLFYDELTTAITLLLVLTATNLLQYVAVDGAMSHAFIFPLYAAMLYYSAKWTLSPTKFYAVMIGLVLGLATSCRPTELIMLFIPLFWMTSAHNLKEKFNLLWRYKTHLIIVFVCFFIAILPQLLYWKYVTGSWMYDVGSKWYFLNPWWRVLIGFEKGWFIYTPVTLFFIIGLFFIKNKPFKWSVITFCLLNIWIVIAWHEWQYGASYSTRALTQSYPVFALALASVVEKVKTWRFRFFAAALGLYLVFVNVFQIQQYNSTVLHYSDMNARYYAAIYLDADPTPLDFSLLDSDELISSDQRIGMPTLYTEAFTSVHVDTVYGFRLATITAKNLNFVSARCVVDTFSKRPSGFIAVNCFRGGQSVKEKKFRLATPGCESLSEIVYQHDVLIPENCDSLNWVLYCYDGLSAKKMEMSVTGK